MIGLLVSDSFLGYMAQNASKMGVEEDIFVRLRKQMVDATQKRGRLVYQI